VFEPDLSRRPIESRVFYRRCLSNRLQDVQRPSIQHARYRSIPF
jgi:hypothetical protein